MAIDTTRHWLYACIHLVCFLSPATALWHSRSSQSPSASVLLVETQDVRSGQQLLPGAGLCGTKIANPPDAATMDCPLECPFIRPDTAHFCSFTCVKKEDCDNRSPLTSFADPMTHVCSPCAAQGCLQCGATRYDCLKCNDYMVLSEDGACVAESRHVWAVAYWVVGLVFASIVLYVVCLGLRPVVNELALERAEDFRAWSKLSHNREGEISRPHHLDTNMCHQNVAGAGMMLHFCWQRAVIFWAIAVTFALFILSKLVAMVPDDMHPNDGDVFASCAAAGSKQVLKELKRSDFLYLYFTFGIYVFSTLGALLLFVHHRYKMRQCHSSDEMSDKLCHYAMSASGFPLCSGQPGAEQTYKDFFRNAFPGTNIIGVSIAWDVANSDLKLDTQVEHELDMLDRDRDARMDARISSARDTHRSEEGEEGGGCFKSQRCCHLVDDVILSAFTPDTEGCLEGKDLSNKLENMTSTGTVFVVFQTSSQRNKACDHKTLQYDGSTITLEKAWHDPETVLWENFTARSGIVHNLTTGGKCAICAGGLFIAVTLWAYLVYHPVSSYILSFEIAPGGGVREHWWDEAVQATLLSIPIILSNQILYAVCDGLSQWIHFQSTGSTQMAYVVMYTVFVSYQTILDISIVVQKAMGHHTENTWRLAQASGVLGSKAVAQNPSIRDTLYLEMVGYLYPGTLLIPYLLEPVGLGICQYHLFKWMIRSRSSIRIQTAENLLVALPYDLTRYGDILISIICCVSLCFIATAKVYQVFCYLLAMLLFCYVWDHWRVLRLCPRFFEDDNKLDGCVTMMFSIPCGLLAAAVVFRTYGAHEDLIWDLTRTNTPMWCVFAFFIHVAFHLCTFFLIIACIKVHPAVTSDQENKCCSYEHAASATPYNWFNSNHVHCLRSKYIHEHGGNFFKSIKQVHHGNDKPTWCIPTKPGREYLLEKAPELGLFYEARAKDKHHDRAHMREVLNEKFGAAAKAIGWGKGKEGIPEEDDQPSQDSNAKLSHLP